MYLQKTTQVQRSRKIIKSQVIVPLVPPPMGLMSSCGTLVSPWWVNVWAISGSDEVICLKKISTFHAMTLNVIYGKNPNYAETICLLKSTYSFAISLSLSPYLWVLHNGPNLLFLLTPSNVISNRSRVKHLNKYIWRNNN